MMFGSAVVRHKTEGGKLDVAPIKRDCKITQQPDERFATRTGDGEMGVKPERQKDSRKDRIRQERPRNHTLVSIGTTFHTVSLASEDGSCLCLGRGTETGG